VPEEKKSPTLGQERSIGEARSCRWGGRSKRSKCTQGLASAARRVLVESWRSGMTHWHHLTLMNSKHSRGYEIQALLLGVKGVQVHVVSLSCYNKSALH
jgi:hypothetical protein